MKILIRNSDNVVIYAQDDLILDTEAHGDNWRDPNFNVTNATLIDATLPRLWSGAVWSYINAVWTVVDPARYAELLNAEKAAMWAKIKAERERRKYTGGFLVGTLWFDSDPDSRSQYLTMLNMATEQALLTTYVFRPAWKTMSGATTPMTVALVRQIRDAGFATDAAIFDNAEAHKTAMEASAAPLSYDFSTGWPATFA